MNHAFTPVSDREPVESMSLTADLVALCHRKIVEPERDPDMVRFGDADFDRAGKRRSGKTWLWPNLGLCLRFVDLETGRRSYRNAFEHGLWLAPRVLS